MCKMRKTAVLLAAVLILVSGCGKEETPAAHGTGTGAALEDGDDGTGAQEPDGEKRHSWNVTHIALEDSYELATIKDDRVYGCFRTDGGYSVSVQDIVTGESGGRFFLPGVAEVQNITVDARDRLCLFGVGEQGNALWQIDPDGEIHTVENKELETAESFDTQKAFWADSNGFYYLWYQLDVPCSEVYEDGREDVYTFLDRIYVLDQDMNVLCYEQVPDSYGNKLVSLLFDEEGVPMILARDEDGYYTRRVRTEDGEAYEANRLDEADEDVMYRLETGGKMALTGDGLLYAADGALHLYRMNAPEGENDEAFLDLALGGVFQEDIVYLGMRGGTVEIIDRAPESGESEYTRFEAGESGQTVLSLGVMTLDPALRKTITAFNRSQDQVRIDPVDYVEDYDYESAYERLKLDVLKGSAPDLFDAGGIDYEILADKGVFLDLYEFMDRDPECGGEKMVSSVLKAYETGGHLYVLAPAFSVFTVWGGSSLVQGRDGVSMEELIGLLRDNGGDINSIYGFSADESVLRTLCAQGMDEFIDWEQGTCSFTSKEFLDLLEFAKGYEGPHPEGMYGAIRSGKILLSLGVINSVESCRLQSELYGEKIQFIGYPTAEGSGSRVYFNGTRLAINAKTEYPDEAWEFVRYCLLSEYDGTGFPVVRARLEKALEKSLEEEMTEDENGGRSPVYRISYFEPENDVSILVEKADQADVDAVRELVEKASGKYEYHNEIQNIIEEEAEAYFQGQKSAEEAAAIIQNRVQLYLDERN